LIPFLTGKTRLSEIGADGLSAALDALLPWNLKRRLEEEAPTHFQAPTGNRHAIDYESAGAPALHIRVQELFGVTQHPSINAGCRSCSARAAADQITPRLPGFGDRGRQSRTEMKGAIRAAPGPNPASAAPTAQAKPRGT
jgi:ATP-dependent helicase HrpB